MADQPKSNEQIEQDARDEESKKAAEARKSEIAKINDKEERQIVELYEQGVQTYAIAKKVYKFVNQDTVGTVTLVIRKHYADDFNEVEDINSTKGYTGIGTS
jgi:DNA-binding NarL/FixJ family response regulator